MRPTEAGLRIVLLDPGLHDRTEFSCGTASLDEYLRSRASQHQRDGIATTHILMDSSAPGRILGYVSLAAAQMELDGLQPPDRKRLPRYPVPAIRVGRLAVTRVAQGHGYGELLLGHAANIALRLRSELGVRILIVDALDDRVVAYYRAYGFRPTTSGSLTLYLPLGKGDKG